LPFRLLDSITCDSRRRRGRNAKRVFVAAVASLRRDVQPQGGSAPRSVQPTSRQRKLLLIAGEWPTHSDQRARVPRAVTDAQTNPGQATGAVSLTFAPLRAADRKKVDAGRSCCSPDRTADALSPGALAAMSAARNRPDA